MISSEYTTGQIRSTLAATPQRFGVLADKALTFVVVLVAGLVTTVVSFATGQAIFSGSGLD